MKQLRYVFMELPKLKTNDIDKVKSSAELWAWLFRCAEGLQSIPESLPDGPQQEALKLANEATFTADERDAYDKVNAEIWQGRQLQTDAELRGLARGKEEGKADGLGEGEARGLHAGLIQTIETLCVVFSIELTEERKSTLKSHNFEQLEALKSRLVQDKAWPESD